MLDYNYPGNVIKRNIIAYHSKIWVQKPLLCPIGSENLLTDEFYSSNDKNYIKSRQDLLNRIFSLDTNTILYSIFFYHVTGAKTQSGSVMYGVEYKFNFIFAWARSLAPKITRFTTVSIGLTQLFTWFCPPNHENWDHPQNRQLSLTAENGIFSFFIFFHN